MPGELRIGISGWRYAPWRGGFYPKGLRQADELSFAARHLNFNEINGTFYSLQRPSSFQTWHDATPGDFQFAVKGPRFISHIKRLREVGAPLANFFASGVLALGEKLGPILWQFPANFKFDPDLLEAFFKLLPRDTKSAVKLAKKHDDRLSGDRVHAKCSVDQPIRYAMEIRSPTFEAPAFIALLRKHNIALVAADAAGEFPFLEDVTADFMYLRLHGAEELYASGYRDDDIAGWAKKIRAWSTGKEPVGAKRVAAPLKKHPKSRDVFCVFDNTMKDRAPFNAIRLAQNLGLKAGPDRAKTFPVPSPGNPGEG